MVPGGYNGKILRVNLSNGIIKSEEIDDILLRRYIGGIGLISYYLWKELDQGIDALSPENKLIFALGPVSGLLLPGAARFCVGAKSPLTGGIAKAESGGFFMAELKRSGYDMIIIEGKAEKPVYLWVHDGEAEIKDAGQVWGKETKETEADIRAELGDNKVQLALIGPGGENQVRFACIMCGLRNAAGRGGLGAVMGAKNLKAVAARGHTLPKVASPDRVTEIRRTLTFPHPLSEFGTGGDVVLKESTGNLPVRNFRDGLFSEIKNFYGVMKEDLLVGMEGCFACPVRCKKMMQFEEPYVVDKAYGGPEYETIAALGSNCGVGNIKAMVKGNERCNAYSLDTISTGSVIGFAMECFEKGLLTKQDTGGIDLSFGNAEAMLEVIELITRRQGIGKLLAEGVARVAKTIGNGSQDFAIEVKGLEAAMHDPRMKSGMGIGYMVTPAGADHVCNMHDDMYVNEVQLKPLHLLGFHNALPLRDVSPRKVALFRVAGQFSTILDDSYVTCLFLPYKYPLKVDILSAVTGWDTGMPEIMKVAERIITILRLFNLKHGLTAKDDYLPKRFYQPKTDGVLSDKPLDKAKMEKAKRYYYTLMNWDAEGVPLPETVEELYIE
jgi:aldehyde:ferredoxin oxidoreductase